MAGAGNAFRQAAGGFESAGQAAQAATQFQPQQVGTTFGYTPQDVTAQTAAGGIQTYMNPYTQQVIDRSRQDIERQRQMAVNTLGAQASAAGAFGGSRQGVAESLTNEAFARQAADQAAALRAQGFNTALGAAQQDVANFLQSDLANQAAGARAAEFGQQTGLQAGMANQQAAQAAAALNLQGAGQLADIANLGFGRAMDITRQQQQQGLAMQALNQQIIDAARAQYAGFTGSPERAIQLPIAAVSAGNMGQGTQTATTTQQPGLLNYLALGAKMAAAIPTGGASLAAPI